MSATYQPPSLADDTMSFNPRNQGSIEIIVTTSKMGTPTSKMRRGDGERKDVL